MNIRPNDAWAAPQLEPAKLLYLFDHSCYRFTHTSGNSYKPNDGAVAKIIP
jgi:hypothetical protein